VRVSARPGEDVVVLTIANGPTLVLHPADARDLLLAQSAATTRSALAAAALTKKIDGKVDAGVYRLGADTLEPLKGSGRKLDAVPAAADSAWSASSVTRSSVAATSDTCPTASVTALSPKYPSSEAPTSIEITSPSLSTRRPEGIPWITSSLIDAQIVAG